jgi:hypothetical protein
MRLLEIDDNTGSPGDVYFETDDWPGNGVYNSSKNCYYNFSRSRRGQIYFYKFDFTIDTITDIEYYGTMDTFKVKTQLLCNNTNDKTYYISIGQSGERLYALTIGATVTEKLLYISDTLYTISSPVIDEKTGYIYFANGPNLIKIDPNSGASTLVATYSNVHLSDLHFNKNDGFFYGVNTFSYPYTFIKVNTENGSVIELSEINYVDSGTYYCHTFDVCNNRYIIGWRGAIYWIDCSNGSVVRRSAPGFSQFEYYIEQSGL